MVALGLGFGLGVPLFWKSSHRVPVRLVEAEKRSSSAKVPVGEVRLPAPESPKSSIVSAMIKNRSDGGVAMAAALRQLGNDLDREDMEALCQFLRERGTPDHPVHMFDVKNDVMNLLRRQKTSPEKLTSVLLEIFCDKEQDQVLRSYSLQHLALWHDRAPASEKLEIEKALWLALDQKECSIPGTALISLKAISQTEPAFDQSKLQRTAATMAKDAGANELTRITALQICGQAQVKEVLPLARELAKTSGSDPLKISAIAALGDLGESKDRVLLKQLAVDSNLRLQPAAVAALKRLEKRLDT